MFAFVFRLLFADSERRVAGVLFDGAPLERVVPHDGEVFGLAAVVDADAGAAPAVALVATERTAGVGLAGPFEAEPLVMRERRLVNVKTELHIFLGFMD